MKRSEKQGRNQAAAGKWGFGGIGRILMVVGMAAIALFSMETARAATGTMIIKETGNPFAPLQDLANNGTGAGWSWSASNEILTLTASFEYIDITSNDNITILTVYANVSVGFIRSSGPLKLTGGGKLIVDEMGALDISVEGGHIEAQRVMTHRELSLRNSIVFAGIANRIEVLEDSRVAVRQVDDLHVSGINTTVRVLEDVNGTFIVSSGKATFFGNVEGWIGMNGGEATVKGDVTGTLMVHQATVTVDGDVTGTLSVQHGTVTIDGNVTGPVTVDNDGTITVGGDVTGSLTVGNELGPRTGTAIVTGNVVGELLMAGDVVKVGGSIGESDNNHDVWSGEVVADGFFGNLSVYSKSNVETGFVDGNLEVDIRDAMVNVTANVSGNLRVEDGTVYVGGNVGGTATIGAPHGAPDVTVDGEVFGDIVVLYSGVAAVDHAKGDVTVSETGKVKVVRGMDGKLTVTGGVADISGEIGKDGVEHVVSGGTVVGTAFKGLLTVSGGDVTAVVVEGDLETRGGKVIVQKAIFGGLTVSGTGDVEVDQVLGDMVVSDNGVVGFGYGYGNLTVLDNGKVSSAAGGINGELTVSGGEVNMVDPVGINGDESHTVSGGTVVAGNFAGSLTVTGGEVELDYIKGNIVVEGGTVRVTDNMYTRSLTVSGGKVTVNGPIDEHLTVSGNGVVEVGGDVDGDANISGGETTVIGEIKGAINHTGGLLNGQRPPLSFTAVQTGGVSGVSNSTGIEITFDRPISGLLESDIMLVDGTGSAVKGAGLSGSDAVYTIVLSDVTTEGTVALSIDHVDYNVISNPQMVDVVTALHAVTVVSDGAGATGDGDYLADALVYINAGTPPVGQRFVNWKASPAVSFDDAAAEMTHFAMPAAHVEVTAVFKPVYAVTVSSAGAGATGGGDYLAGETVGIDAGQIPAGYRFDRWTAAPTVAFAKATDVVTSFAMPAGAVAVTAHFTAVYTIAIPSFLNGNVLADKAVAAAGETVALVISPDRGYELSRFSVQLANGGAVAVSGDGLRRTFAMPAGAVTVTAVFQKTAGLLTVEEARRRIENAEFTVSQAEMNTREAVNEWLVGALDRLLAGLNISVTDANVSIYNFAAAIAGTPERPLGWDGKFAASVSLSIDGNYATIYAFGTIKTTAYVPPTGMEQVNDPNVYVQNGVLHIAGLALDTSWSVFDAGGKLVHRGVSSGNISLPARGVYIVLVGNRVLKIGY